MDTAMRPPDEVCGSADEAAIVEHQRFAAWLRRQIRPTFDTAALGVDAVADRVAGWVRQRRAALGAREWE